MSEGLKLKYHITKADGREADPQGVYFILKLNSNDPAHGKACREAARCYAEAIKDHLPELAKDLAKLCDKIEVGLIDGLFPR